MAYVIGVWTDGYVIDSPTDWRAQVATATQRLLDATRALSDADWQVIISLPGWTRAHLAAHLAHHGRALAEMAQQLVRTGQSVDWHAQHSEAELNAGARRPADQLQAGLEQSATALGQAFDQLDDAAWAIPLRTALGPLPATGLLVDRLNEVVLHHIDLELGLDFADLDPQLTRALLQWNLFRTASRFARVQLRVVSDEGFTATVGQGTVVTVRGAEADILGWLTGRKDPAAVQGADDLDLGGPI
jgi:maleylpyruvate isomerase